MAKRKAIPKSVRFEVLKRDSFTCQYCGKSAPSVVLHIDHIKPVSKEGGNEITNLITSCTDCNFGKGAKTLDDNSAVAKQKRQLDELQERREQIELMIQWKDELSDLSNIEADAAVRRFEREAICKLSDKAKAEIVHLTKKYGLSEMCDAIQNAVEGYCEIGQNGGYTIQSVDKAFRSLSGILKTRNIMKEKPWMDDVYHVVSIANKYLSYCPQKHVMMGFVESAILAGYDPCTMKTLASRSGTWSHFAREVADGSQ